MLYRNRETGATVDVVSELSGVWEPVKAPAPRKSRKTEIKPEDSSPETKDDAE